MSDKSEYFIVRDQNIYEVVIGLEVHAQVTSNSKLFSSSSTKFGAEPNTQVSLVDAAFPGMLPVINEFCVKQAIKTGIGLKAKINNKSVFDRKNYFYADLPQGYQISQYKYPIVGEGNVTLDMPNGQKKIGIEIVTDYNVIESLDWVIYRGTIQHLDSPFRSLSKAYNTLKKGGRLAILATPNINSIYYKLFNDLPALDSKRNFYLPSIESINNIMKIIGFEQEKVEFPYLKSPYSNVYSDFYIFFKKLIKKLFLNNVEDNDNCSFPGNMMNIIYKK